MCLSSPSRHRQATYLGSQRGLRAGEVPHVRARAQRGEMGACKRSVWDPNGRKAFFLDPLTLRLRCDILNSTCAVVAIDYAYCYPLPLIPFQGHCRWKASPNGVLSHSNHNIPRHVLQHLRHYKLEHRTQPVVKTCPSAFSDAICIKAILRQNAENLGTSTLQSSVNP